MSILNEVLNEADVQKTDILIMCEDVPVMAVNFDLGKFLVLNETLLPFGLKRKVKKSSTF